MKVLQNVHARRAPYPEELRAILSLAAHRDARAVVETWPGYEPTQLHSLPATARELGLSQLWIKDESTRFGLGAFKSIGGAYAVYRFLAEQVRAQRPDADTSSAALMSGAHRDITSQITVACASAGNHGRAVAWGAQLFGARCIVYLYKDVSAGRRAAIEKLGAIVDTSAADYDQAVRNVALAAQHNGWQVISDTAYPGYVDIPRTVMQGYSVIAQEVLEQLGQQRPTHVLLQVGVGGFAAGIAAHLWETLGTQRPAIISVEPTGAACLLESLAAQQMTVLPQVSSIMGGLCCGEVSLLAWDILRQVVDWAVAIPDQQSIAAMLRLAHPLPGEPRIVAGESGAAGFAALLNLSGAQPDPLERFSHRPAVLVFITEGATDAAAWQRYTGEPLESV